MPDLEDGVLKDTPLCVLGYSILAQFFSLHLAQQNTQRHLRRKGKSNVLKGAIGTERANCHTKQKIRKIEEKSYL